MIRVADDGPRPFPFPYLATRLASSGRMRKLSKRVVFLLDLTFVCPPVAAVKLAELTYLLRCVVSA